MTILFAILLFSFLIFIHEFGHFIAAKLSGVQVNEFAMFMGPAIFKWKKGETQYSIRCIPIGGYCAMEGEDEDSDNPRAFTKAKWWKKLIILVAGAALNFIAGLLICVVLMLPQEKIAAPEIDTLEDFCTIEGLQEGDRILKIDGERIYLTSNISMILALNPGDTHDVVVERNGKVIELNDLVMQKHKVTDENGVESYRYGLLFKEKKATFGVKVTEGVKMSADFARSVRLSLQMLFRGQAKFSDLSGPVGIVGIMSDSAESADSTQAALMNLLYFGAFIAINLAIMNLLPLPALDGGRVVALLLTLLIEKVTRKKLDPKYEGYVHAAGMILLLGLMAVIFMKDIIMIFKR